MPLWVRSFVGLRVEPLRCQGEGDEDVIQEFLLEDERPDYVDRYACEEIATVAAAGLASDYREMRQR
jgi:hypothetical protein